MAPATGASAALSAPSAVTNAAGVASVTATANGTPGGPYNVTASAPGLTSVNFSLTNTAAQVAVPNVVGLTQAAATTAITNAGLTVDPGTTASSSTVPSGSVISESPTAATLVNVGSAVSLVISTGPAQYLLTTAANPSAGGTVSPVTGNQTSSGVVNLKAAPIPGYVFSNWSGSAVANANSASTTITMTGPESVTANFVSEIAVSASNIAFGTVYLGSITTKNVTVTNIGTTPITMHNPILSIVRGGDSSEFTALNLCPQSLAAGKSCTITITFIAGPFFSPQAATLSIMDNAPGSPQTVGLSAQVIDPQASLNPNSLIFGNQTVNTRVTKTVTLKNTGATTLEDIAISVTGKNASQFALTPSSSCGSSLISGSSCTISVTFKPVAKVPYSATLQVTDNAHSGTQTVPLSGTGH